MEDRHRPRWLSPAAIVAGVLWAAHGVFELGRPWGEVSRFDPGVGYGVITDAALFRIYGLPGPPALLLTGAVVFVLASYVTAGRLARAARWLAVASSVLGAAALVGVAIPFEPPFEAGMVFGRVLVSAAALTLGGAAWRRSEALPGPSLAAAGALGLLVLAARVGVNALESLPRAAAIAVVVAFGAAWVVSGWQLRR